MRKALASVMNSNAGRILNAQIMKSKNERTNDAATRGHGDAEKKNRLLKLLSFFRRVAASPTPRVSSFYLLEYLLSVSGKIWTLGGMVTCCVPVKMSLAFMP